MHLQSLCTAMLKACVNALQSNFITVGKYHMARLLSETGRYKNAIWVTLVWSNIQICAKIRHKTSGYQGDIRHVTDNPLWHVATHLQTLTGTGRAESSQLSSCRWTVRRKIRQITKENKTSLTLKSWTLRPTMDCTRANLYHIKIISEIHIYSEPLVRMKNKIPAPMNGALRLYTVAMLRASMVMRGERRRGAWRHARWAGADWEDVEGEQTKETQWNVAAFLAVIANWSTRNTPREVTGIQTITYRKQIYTHTPC